MDYLRLRVSRLQADRKELICLQMSGGVSDDADEADGALLEDFHFSVVNIQQLVLPSPL